jgi:chaperonin GroEL
MSAAVKDGVVPGGGSSLAHVATLLDGPCAASPDELLGRAAVRASLTAPLTWICQNAGQEGPRVAAKVVGQDWGIGFDVKSGQLADLTERGVVDPVSIICGALQTAASTVALALTSEVLIAERPDPDQPPDDLGWHGRDTIVTGADSSQQPPQRLSPEQLKRLARRVPR